MAKVTVDQTAAIEPLHKVILPISSDTNLPRYGLDCIDSRRSHLEGDKQCGQRLVPNTSVLWCKKTDIPVI